MPSRTELVFPSYLCRGSIKKSTQLNRELKREIHILSKMDKEGREWSQENYLGGYSSYASLCHLHQTSPHFAELEKLLRVHVDSFARRLQWDLMGRELRMTTCWVNMMGYGTHHALHIHPLSVLSGVYYVNAPAGASALKIEDPRMSFFMAAPPRRAAAPAREQNYLHLAPKAGHFVLFESWMRHEVPPHRGREPRLSVSFNYEL